MIGYYRKFCANYGVKAKPLNDLTRKGMFKWSDEAHRSVELLTEVMCTVPVLQLPYFTQVFVLERHIVMVDYEMS